MTSSYKLTHADVADMVSDIYHYVVKHEDSQLTNRAQSDWGQDRYELNGGQDEEIIMART